MELQNQGEKKKRISVIVIFETLILIVGTILSISGTCEALHYSVNYWGYFGLALLGIGFIVLLLARCRKKYTWIIGVALIFLYLFTAGWGYIVCVLNAERMNRLEYYSGKEIYVIMDETRYSWDGESTFYDAKDLQDIECYDVWVDDEMEKHMICRKADDDSLYLEIYSGATGDFLVLKK